MTQNQWRMLEILERHSGEGTMEVLLAWGDYYFGDSEADEIKAWNVCKLVVSGMVRTLVRKGLATDDEWGYGITDDGLALLEKHRKRN